MKRLTMTVGALAASALAFAAGTAAGGPTVEEFPVSFTLTSASCPNLPAGTTVEGSGWEKSITSTRTDRNGVTTVMNTSHASGTATDQAGNHYVFNYSNSFKVSDTGPGSTFTGGMVDSFSLAGNGPAGLANGFLAAIAISADFSTFTFQELSSRGDPIDFVSGSARCDPL